MNSSAVLSPRHLARLFVSDALNAARDPVLFLVLALSLVLPLGLWYWGVSINIWAEAAFGVSGLSRYAAPVALVIPGFLIGWVAGFLILEERDDGVSPAIAITPVGTAGFAFYRLTMTAVLTFAISLTAAWLLLPHTSAGLRGSLALLCAMQSIAVASLLAAVANNRVQGLALSKVINVGILVPLLALVPSPWRFLGGLVPTFWIGELSGLSPVPVFPIASTLALAAAIHVATVVGCYTLLLRRRNGT